MPWIDETWLRTAYNALQDTLRVDDRTRNEMIQFLLDEGFWNADTLKTYDAQVARWNACLNPNKPEFFKLGEVWALMARFGRHQLFHAMAQDLGYDVRAIPTEARRHELLERIALSSERHETEVAAARAAMERLALPVPTTRTGPVGRFSLVDSSEQGASSAGGRLACP